MTRSLSFLRKSEALSDLRFLCHHRGGQKEVKAHKTIFLGRSPLLMKVFSICQKQQVRLTLLFSVPFMTA